MIPKMISTGNGGQVGNLTTEVYYKRSFMFKRAEGAAAK
jgi:hypothetical protein